MLTTSNEWIFGATSAMLDHHYTTIITPGSYKSPYATEHMYEEKLGSIDRANAFLQQLTYKYI